MASGGPGRGGVVLRITAVEVVMSVCTACTNYVAWVTRGRPV